jgi:hypothetical protein
MHSIRAGIILGVLVGIWTFVMGFTGWYKHPYLLFAFFLVIPIQFGVILWALGKTAAEQPFGLQVRDGVLLSLVGSVIVFLSSMLFTTVAFPRYFEELRSLQEGMLRQAGKSEVEIKAMLDVASQGMTPMAQAMNGVIGTIVAGVILSAIVAAFARRRDTPGTPTVS